MKNISLLILFITFLAAPRLEAQQEQSRKLNYLFNEAIRLKAIGSNDEAFETLRHCYAIDSLSAPVLYELGNYYLESELPDLAMGMLQKAVTLDKENKWYKWSLANACIVTGKNDLAIQLLEEFVKTDANNMELLDMLIQLYTETNQLQKAIGILDLMENQVGMNEQLSVGKFRYYMAMGDSLKALAEIDKLVNYFKGDLHYLVLKADILLTLGQLQEAGEIYKQVEKQDPNNSDLAVSILNYYGMTNQAVESALRRAIYNVEVPLQAKQSIMGRYCSTLKPDDKEKLANADSLLAHLVAQNPTDVDVRLLYAAVLSVLKRNDEAVAVMESVVELDPGNEKAWDFLLNYYVQKKEFSRLRTMLEKTITAMPEKGTFYYFLGLAYQQENRFDDALKTYQKGIDIAQLDGKSAFLIAQFYGQIGDLYQQMKGKKEDVIDAYEKSLKLNPKNIVVLNNYAYFLTCRKLDLSKAERMIARCMELEPGNPTYLDTYAWVFFMQDNYSLALLYIERAVNQGVEQNGEVLEHYGDILFKNDMKEQAFRQWEKALKQEGYSPLLKEKIATKNYIEPKIVKD